MCVCVHACRVSHSVGKTSLLHQYVHNTFYEDYQTTLGASILSKIIRVEDTTLKLQVSSLALCSTDPPKTYPAPPGQALTW